MPEETFQALVVEEDADGHITRRIKQRTLRDLPDADVQIQVEFSSLNYKDALSANGYKGITRNYPHTPGIDAVGVVSESKTNAFSPGDEVVVTGYDLGMNISGGLGEFIAVPAEWIVPKPVELTAWECMALGTAGFTAALCVWRLDAAGVSPDDGDVLVTGATGGVGCLAISLMNQLGYRVVGLTGKTEFAQFLQGIGATEILNRVEFTTQANRPLLPARWAGAIDAVGGPILDAVLKSVKYGGAVACCGMAASPQLNTNVYPFILRDVSLLGIASAECQMELRCQLWSKLANEWKIRNLNDIANEIELDQVDEAIDAMLAGIHHGRTVVKIGKE